VDAPITLVGSPTALGGHFGGMERTPGQLRAHGLVAALGSRPALAGRPIVDAGDAPNDPGWAPDPDPRAKNRARIVEYLPRLTALTAATLADRSESRLLVVGGDCTSHAGALAGLRRAVGAGLGGREPRLGICWFDAHGDFNTPDTTPSGNVWGMPFAMLCGRGEADLVGACDGPLVDEADAALLGGQVLDETESRMLAASPVAQFGAGMLSGTAGLAALRAWADTVSARIDGWYIAFDLDAIDAAEGLSLAMPEPDGISVVTAVAAVRAIAAAGPVLGFGATAAMARDDLDFARTVAVIAELTEAALA
jgi:arginase